MRKILFLIILMALLGGACSGGETEAVTSGTTAAGATRLTDDYDDALSVPEQLAVGTIQLEETALAVDETQAAELLPLWQALQSLSSSDTTAPAEVTAIANQIQGAMSPEQIQAIAEMALTAESMTEILESGALRPAGDGTRAGQQDEQDGSGRAGPPGGGLSPGGGPPGGGLPGGGPGGVDEDTLATRQAQFAGGGFEGQALFGPVIRLLQTRTGDAPENQRGAINQTVFAVVGEATDLSTEEIQAQMADGASLAEIITANGGDVDRVRAALVDALEELPNIANLDADQLADRWLGTDP